jgi:hypothetical protein
LRLSSHLRLGLSSGLLPSAAHTKSAAALLLTAGCQYYTKLLGLVQCACKYASKLLYSITSLFTYADFKFVNAGFFFPLMKSVKMQVAKARKSQHDIR